jgi:hypothetical protein
MEGSSTSRLETDNAPDWSMTVEIKLLRTIEEPRQLDQRQSQIDSASRRNNFKKELQSALKSHRWGLCSVDD